MVADYQDMLFGFNWDAHMQETRKSQNILVPFMACECQIISLRLDARSALLPPRVLEGRTLRSALAHLNDFDLSPTYCATSRSCRCVMKELTTKANFRGLSLRSFGFVFTLPSSALLDCRV